MSHAEVHPLDTLEAAGEPAPRPSFAALYEEHFEFVWRNLRRLGVAAASLDDAAQDVFLVVHRRLPEFLGRSSIRTWLFGILRRVAHDHRRSQSRRGSHEQIPAGVVDGARGPLEETERAEAVRLLDALLGKLDEDKRMVFVLAELEQMTAPEIAEALELNLNTVYSRLRAARRAFDEAVARLDEGSGS